MSNGRRRGCLPSLGIDDEARRLASTGGIGIEGAGLTEADGDDASHHVLDGGLPLSGIGGLCLIEDGDLVVFQVALGSEARGLDIGCVLAGRVLAVQGMAELLERSVIGRGGGLPFGSRGGACAIHSDGGGGGGGGGDSGGQL